MERYLTKLISVNFVAGIFAILFGFFNSDSLILAQQSEPLKTFVLSSDLPKSTSQSAVSSSVSFKIPEAEQGNRNIAKRFVQGRSLSSIPTKVSSVTSVSSSGLGGKDFFVILGQKARKPGLLERIRNTILGSDIEDEDVDPNGNAADNSAGRNNNNNNNSSNNRPRQVSPAQPIVPPKPVTVPKDSQPEAPTADDLHTDAPSRTNSLGVTVPSARTANTPIRVSPYDGMSDVGSNELSSLKRLQDMRESMFGQQFGQYRTTDDSPYPNTSASAANDPRGNFPSRRSLPDYGDEYWQEDFGGGVPVNHRQDNAPNPFAQHNPWEYEANGNAANVDPYSRAGRRAESPYEIDEAQKMRLIRHRDNNRDGVASTNSSVGSWNRQANPPYSPSPSPSPSTSSPRVAQNVPNRQPSTTEKRLTVSPLIEVETEGDLSAIVGRETRYRIRVSNRGGATAEQVVLTIEIPSWLKFQMLAVTSGRTEIREIKKENPKLGLRNFVWTIGEIKPSQEELLELSLVPQECRAIDLKIHQDFHKPSIVTQIVVEEAVIEMELQGPDEILWGTKVVYTLVVRNTGSGDAEQVKLELMETGSELREYTFPLIKAGEEKAIFVDVYAGKLQKNVDVNIQASGAYDVNAKIMKKVKILRPEVMMSVDMAETQFVGSPAEFVVKVKNSGDAEARNLDLAVTIPIGTKFISSTNNGELTPQNQVRWSIESLPVNGEFVASVVCTPHREGVCKIDTILKDKEDSVAQCTSVFTAEAISDLRMSVEPPNGPIEVGQDAVFVINVTNRGTKLASNVALFLYCSSGLKPISTLGDKNRIGNGVVEFELIPSISAGQTVTMKVVTKAEYGGNHRIRAELMSPYTADVAAGKVEPQTKLLSEQTLSFYQRKGIVSTRQPTKPETQPTPTPTPTPPTPTEEPINVDPFPQ